MSAHVTSGLSGPVAPAPEGIEPDDADWERRARNRTPAARWIGARLRGLVLAALCGCLALFMLIRAVTQQPALDAGLSIGDDGSLRAAGVQAAVTHLIDGDGQPQRVDRLLLQRSARWMVDDAERARLIQQHEVLASTLQKDQVRAIDATGLEHRWAVAPRGATRLGWMFWLLSSLALLLYLVAMVVVLARPGHRNLLYALMALAQAGSLLLLAVLSTPTPGWPAGLMRWEQSARTAFDLLSAGALVHVSTFHPRRLPLAGMRAGVGWIAVAALLLLTVGLGVHGSWWLTQLAQLVAGLVAVGQLSWMQRREPHPLAVLLLRVSLVAIGILSLLTLAAALVQAGGDPRGHAAAFGSTVWVMFLSLILVMLPFLSSTQQLMREFSLVAGVSTVATALDLLFVAVFSLGNFASLTLATFISLALYAGARQWLVSRVIARRRVSTERMFEHVYRMAREVQLQPQSSAEQMRRLLRELFDPIDARIAARGTRRAQVLSDGTHLVAPVPVLAGNGGTDAGAVVLGFADRGRRLFTDDDARLADRVLDLIARAVAFDQAVEHGRMEERTRIAQDLHDDIGARLLTLMYKAPTPEMEDYVRHTLKDLKTLTRGLAAPNHPLSHAAAEWKADIVQRVSAAGCELEWSFACDDDLELSVVQWSALTRVLRELVSNTLQHSHANQLRVDIRLERGTLTLDVADDGEGREPERWTHGLGLGGVRKRVKQLGGDVAWRQNTPRGIVCSVSVPGLTTAAWRPR